MIRTRATQILTVFLAAAMTVAAPLATVHVDAYDPYSEDVLVSAMDFDGLDEGATTGDIIPYLKNKSNYSTTNTFSSSYYRMYHTSGNALVETKSNADAAIKSGYLNDENGLFIENGRLKMAVSGSRTGANANGSMLQMQLNTAIKTGCVRIRFDFAIEEIQGKGEYGDILNFIGNDTYTIFQNGSTLQIKENQTTFDLVSGAEAGVTYHTEIMLNLDEDKAVVSMYDDAGNGSEKQINIPNNNFQSLQFWSRRHNSPDLKKVVYLDNVLVTQPKMPEAISCNVAEKQADGTWAGIIGIEPLVPQLSFNLPLVSVDDVKLYANGSEVTDAQITLSEDGYSFSILKPLSYSVPYSLVIPAQSVKTANKLFLSAQTISFHTMHRPFGAQVTSAAFTDEDGNTVTSLNGLTSITLQTELLKTESRAEQATLLLVLYDADGVMQQIETKTTALSAVPVPTTVPMALPEDDLTGYTLRAYFWGDISGMQIITPTIALGE